MRIKSWFAVLCVMLSLGSSLAGADDQKIKFEVSTNRCVALHQGQTCYQKLRFSWQTPAVGEYCLFQLPDVQPLVCWEGSKKSTFKLNFESDSGVTYEIRSANRDTALASVEVGVAWVYRSGRNSASGWRIF